MADLMVFEFSTGILGSEFVTVFFMLDFSW